MAGERKNWYVIYTKPRSEKKVTKSLEASKLEVYCPLVKEVHQWSDRKRKVEVPLFTSYVFLKIQEKEMHQIYNFPGFIRYLYWLGKPAIVREKEIETIKNWLGNDTFHDLTIDNLKPGDRVKINSGVFKDREAIINRVDTKRLQLVLPELGCTVSVKIREIA